VKPPDIAVTAATVAVLAAVPGGGSPETVNGTGIQVRPPSWETSASAAARPAGQVSWPKATTVRPLAATWVSWALAPVPGIFST
jgi:hypothetical protein